MIDDYLWDGSGVPDPDVAYFEHWAGQLGAAARSVSKQRARTARHRPRSRAWGGYGLGMALGVAVVVLMWLLGPYVGLRAGAVPEPTQASAVSVDVEADRGARRARSGRVPRKRGPVARRPVVVDDEPARIEPRRRAAGARRDRSEAAVREGGARSRAAVAAAGSDDVAPRSREEIVQMLARHSDAIVACYREHSSAPPGALVFLRFDITADGSTEDVRLVRHNFPVFLEGQATGKCLVAEVGLWRWSAGAAIDDTPMILQNPG